MWKVTSRPVFVAPAPFTHKPHPSTSAISIDFSSTAPSFTKNRLHPIWSRLFFVWWVNKYQQILADLRAKIVTVHCSLYCFLQTHLTDLDVLAPLGRAPAGDHGLGPPRPPGHRGSRCLASPLCRMARCPRWVASALRRVACRSCLENLKSMQKNYEANWW